jgi:hypothetical protein
MRGKGGEWRQFRRSYEKTSPNLVIFQMMACIVPEAGLEIRAGWPLSSIMPTRLGGDGDCDVLLVPYLDQEPMD